MFDVKKATFDVTIAKRDPEGKVFQVNGKDLPDASVEAVLRYGIQRWVNDKVGGSDTTAKEKVTEAEALIKRLYDGDVHRQTGGGVTALQAECRKIARDALRTHKGKDAAKAATEDELDAIVDKNRDKIEAQAQAAIEERARRKREAAEMANSIEV